MPKRTLILEDDDFRINWFAEQVAHALVNFTFCTRADVAVASLQQDEYDQIFLDHDLAPHHYSVYDGETCDGRYDEETGYAVAKFLAENPTVSADATIIVHSLNRPAAVRMVRLLRGTGRQAYWTPFTAFQESGRLPLA